jgi:flagellar biosynthetic protein FliR
VEAVFDIQPGTLSAFGLYLIRTSTLVLSCPVVGLASGVSGYKVALIGGLSLLLYSLGGEPLTDVGVFEYGVLGLREILIGFFIGFVLQLFLMIVRVAGELIGHEMGFAMARQIDPVSGIQTPLVTRMYEVFFVLGMLAVDGHLWMVRALERSYERAPVGELGSSAGMSALAQRLFGEMFEAGITFAAPVMVLMLLVSILLGFLARTVPHLNVLEVGFTVRIVVALLAMYLFAPLIAPMFSQSADKLLVWLDTAIDSTGK